MGIKHNGELHNVYSPENIKVIKYSMAWAEHAARVGKTKYIQAYTNLVINPDEM
jgi:hypothetical protein